MTREEASNRLKQWIRNGCDGMTDERLGYIEGWFHKSDKEAFEQAIKALEQEPSGDLVSRQAVLDLCDMRDRYEIPYEYDEDGKHIKGYDEGRIINVTKLNKLPSVNPQEPSVEIVNTEESNDNGTKYLNINVSDSEVKRNPDVIRLCSDVGILEYVKSKTGHWDNVSICGYRCNECGKIQYADDVNELNYCCTCGAKMEK